MVSTALDEGNERPARAAAGPLWRYTLMTGVALALFLAGIAGLCLAFGYASVHIPPWLLTADSALYRATMGLSNVVLTRFIFLLFNDPGIDYSVPIAACLAYVWFRRRHDTTGAAAAIALTLIIGAWTMPYTQAFGFRPRPFMLMPDAPVDPIWREVWTGIPTFPSGHIRELTGLSLVLAYFWRRALWPAAAYTAFIAFSRVYIGAHYPTDVAAGIVVGLLGAAFSLVAVARATRILVSLAAMPRVRAGYAYLMGSGREGAADPWSARAVRAGIGFVALLAGLALLGYIVHIREPRILADYLRNTDSSLAFPLLKLFGPRRAAALYWTFAAGVVVYPALAGLVLTRSWGRGRRHWGRAALSLAIGLALVLLLTALMSPYFARERPFASGSAGSIVAEEWKARWPGPAMFPDPHLLAVVALCTMVASAWPRLRVLAYIYAFLAMLAVLVLGAVWPMDGVATLLGGYWTGRYAMFLTGQVLPATRAEGTSVLG